MLVCARLRYIAVYKWGTERYLNCGLCTRCRLIVPRLRVIFGAPELAPSNAPQTRNPHETKSHEWTEFLVTGNQSKYPARGCAKASHDVRISGRGELDQASPQKMCDKLWTFRNSSFFTSVVNTRRISSGSRVWIIRAKVFTFRGRWFLAIQAH